MLRVVCMALMNVIPVVTTIFGAAYAVQPAYGIGFKPDVYLWIPVLGNIVAVLVIPFVGNLSDKIGRRPPIIVGALCSGLLSFAYLYAISVKNVPLAIVLSILMWGIVYQGYNAVFPSFYPGAVPDPLPRLGDGDLAEHRHHDHRAAAGAVRDRGASRIDATSRSRSAPSPSLSRLSQRPPPIRRGKPSGFRSATSAMPVQRRWRSRSTTASALLRSAAPRRPDDKTARSCRLRAPLKHETQEDFDDART